MIELLRRQTRLAQAFVGDVAQFGDIVIDATIGTGMDTLFLADAVGDEGKVYAYDVQQCAIEHSIQRLGKKKKSVVFYNHGHEHILRDSKTWDNASIKAVMFNLGYLPGGNKEIYTKKKSTLLALEGSLEILIPGGVITVCTYAHESGQIENEAVLYWAKNLGKGYTTHRFQTLNRNGSPELFLIMKNK